MSVVNRGIDNRISGFYFVCLVCPDVLKKLYFIAFFGYDISVINNDWIDLQIIIIYKSSNFSVN